MNNGFTFLVAAALVAGVSAFAIGEASASPGNLVPSGGVCDGVVDTSCNCPSNALWACPGGSSCGVWASGVCVIGG
ncbi:MAG: hypothetical protein ACYDDF_11275 [Thermoplasmatota archaeon]